MSNIRKDSYVVAGTRFGPIYGKVLSVKNGDLHLATDAGESARVRKEGATKITAAEYRANAGVTAETYRRADEASKPESVVKPEANTDRPGGARKPGEKGSGKKAIAIKVFNELAPGSAAGPTRKAFLTAMAEHGLSAKGASTYFYHIRSGRWARA